MSGPAISEVATPLQRERSRSPVKGLLKGELVDKYVEDDLDSGYSAFDLFENKANRVGYTYDDLICMPGHIAFGIHDVVLESSFTRSIRLRTPIVSSPMDTVTESKMAIAMALEGGIGIIHTNMSAEDQATEVAKVKRYESGFIMDPVCIQPTMNVTDLDRLSSQCGFTGFPVTQDGRIGSKLLGLVTKRDSDFVQDRSSTTVSAIMTKFENLVTATEGIRDLGACSTTEVQEFLHAGRLRFELRSPAAQREGGVHGLHSFERKLFVS